MVQFHVPQAVRQARALVPARAVNTTARALMFAVNVFHVIVNSTMHTNAINTSKLTANLDVHQTANRSIRQSMTPIIHSDTEASQASAFTPVIGSTPRPPCTIFSPPNGMCQILGPHIPTERAFWHF
eukprot:752591_1